MKNQPIKMTCKLRHAGKPDAPEKETIWQWCLLFIFCVIIAHIFAKTI
jgi:hypothetical protein